MQSTALPRAPATPRDTTAVPLTVTPSFLLAAFATVPDPRRRRGTRYPLASLLALALVAILRNLEISLLHAEGMPTIAAQRRHFSAHPTEVVRFVVGFVPQNALALKGLRGRVDLRVRALVECEPMLTSRDQVITLNAAPSPRSQLEGIAQ